MKKIFNKKVRAVIKLTIFVIFVLSCVLLTPYTTSADEDSYDAKYGIPASNGARKKLYAGGLIDCVADMKTDKISGGSGTSEKIFKSSTYMKGIILEDEINGVGNSAARKDGLVSCQSLEDSDGNNLWTKLKINRAELFCASGTDPGLFQVVDGTGSCQDVYSGNAAGKLEPVTKSNRDFFTRELIRRKAFNNNIPGVNVETFLPIEQYYVYRDSFFAICANYDTRREDDSVHYRIYDYVGGDEFKKYGYGDKGIVDPASDKFWVSKWDGQMSCDQLMQELNTGDAFTAWVEDTRGSTEGPIRYGENLPGSDDTDGTSGDGTSTSQKTCLTEADSLGWIGCETAESMGSFGSSAYTNLVEPYLEVSPQLFSGDDGARKAWGIFMSIANGGFVILLIVIIFSQLTGIGIDNYGIKKILPKIIVTVILVNASYIICQAAVDVSNIVGKSLLGMLEKIAGDINGKFDLGVMVTALINALGIGTAGASMVIVGSGFWAFLLPLLLGLLGVIIAILFVFFLLGARKALVVVLVVVSPIAMLLYALPNTKKIFDKWFKIFKGMLILYPVCGLLMGGGALASSIILKSTEISNEDDFWTVLSGMVVRIIPIFFIPSLVKGAFAALGGVGAKLSGLGKNLSNKATGSINKGVRNSDWWKNNQERHGVRVNETRAKMLAKRGQRRVDSGRAENSDRFDTITGLTQREALRQARAQSAASKYDKATEDAFINTYDSQLGGESFGDFEGDEYSDTNSLGGRFQKMFDENNSEHPEALAAFTRYMFKRDAKEASKVISNVLSRDGIDGGSKGNSMDALRQVVNNDSSIAGYMKTKETDTFQMMSAGRQAQGLSNYTKNLKNNNHSDWAGMSSGALARAVRLGSEGMSVNTANELLHSQSSNIRDTLQGDPEKRRMLQAYVANGGVENAAHESIFEGEKGKNLSNHGMQLAENYNPSQPIRLPNSTANSSEPTTPSDGMTGELDLHPGNDNSGDNNNDNGSTTSTSYGDDTTYST